MFTGIISDVGAVLAAEPRGEKTRLVVASAYDSSTIALGASIAINGVCLTVVEATPHEPGARVASTSAPKHWPSPRRARSKPALASIWSAR